MLSAIELGDVPLISVDHDSLWENHGKSQSDQMDRKKKKHQNPTRFFDQHLATDQVLLEGGSFVRSPDVC